jgi:hypothetical protein
MKVKIGDKIFNASSEPIMLIFENDKERKSTIENLSKMEDRHKGGPKLLYKFKPAFNAGD